MDAEYKYISYDLMPYAWSTTTCEIIGCINGVIRLPVNESEIW